MTTHLRQQLRAAVADLLDGLATTGSRVEVGRTRPLAADHAPTLLVYTTPAVSGGQETARALTNSYPRIIERSLSLTVMGKVQSNVPCDDDLDTIALEVEAALAADPKLGGLARDSELASTVSQVDADGTRHIGAIRMIYTVTYHTREGTPGSAA